MLGGEKGGFHHSSNPGVEATVYAQLDETSDTTLVKTIVEEKLGMQGIETHLIFSTILRKRKIPEPRVDGETIQDQDP